MLHTVRQEHLSDEVAQAQTRRDEFINKLKEDLLTPLGEHVKNELKEVMPEIDSVAVHPFVPTLEDILSGAKIPVKDSADTALLNKGTGGTCLPRLTGYSTSDGAGGIIR